ncbi:MAG: hypothetical protein M1828_006036 [Chrysothrix sp. TS-e1954]|nr:MAG: hypothetical protein M1828_006036 [Chrysothrix sp. TS-e1954]
MSAPLQLSNLPREAQEALLDSLFEPSPALQDLVLPLPPTQMHTYTDLVQHTRGRLMGLLNAEREADLATLDGILSAHPRLGEKKVATLSQSSAVEQGGLRGDSAAEGELQSLNDAYERQFPGLKFL